MQVAVAILHSLPRGIVERERDTVTMLPTAEII
jgi:hypothetical protein